MMDFRIHGLLPEPFLPLYGLSDEELANRSAKRYVASAKSGFPDRIEMRDAEPGERLILVVTGWHPSMRRRRGPICRFR